MRRAFHSCWGRHQSSTKKENEEALKMPSRSQEGRRCLNMGSLQGSVPGLQSQSHNREQSNTACVSPDHLVRATGGTAFCLSSGRKASFTGFSTCQMSCIILRLTKCQTARQTTEPEQEGKQSAGPRPDAGNSCNCNS